MSGDSCSLDTGVQRLHLCPLGCLRPKGAFQGKGACSAVTGTGRMPPRWWLAAERPARHLPAESPTRAETQKLGWVCPSRRTSPAGAVSVRPGGAGGLFSSRAQGEPFRQAAAPARQAAEAETDGAEGLEAPVVLTLPLRVQQLFPTANPKPSARCLAADRTEAQPPRVPSGVPLIHSSRTRSASQTNRLWHPLIPISL